MAIDRAARADRRARRRAATAQDARSRGLGLGEVSMELDGFLNPARKHETEHLQQVAVAREDTRESGEKSFDLDSGVVRLQRRPAG